MAIIAGAGFGLAVVLNWLGARGIIVSPFLVLSTVAGGWFVVPRGIRAARNRALDMNFLMSVAATGAWVIGERFEAAATLFLFSIAELLESYSMDRARRAIHALMALSPAEATVLREGREVRIPASDVQVTETVIVRPGEKIPVDGEVTAGRSAVNQAAITGESIPVDMEVGSAVFAGTMNNHGALYILSTKPATDTRLARIIHAVAEAQSSRAPTQTFVERFARIYTPVAVGGALVVAILPPLLGLGEAGTWIYRALAMLVVACPCALVISTPVSIVSGLARAARDGVLIRGGAHLESAGTISVVCFDKTGTLTEGQPGVTDVITFDGSSEYDVIRAAMGVERFSEHPLAVAILDFGARRGIDVPASVEFESLPGRGARAILDGTVVYVGNQRLMDDCGIATQQAAAALERLAREGKTGVVVADSRNPLGIIALADRLRPGALEALDSLREGGIDRIMLLTGDNVGAAQAIATELQLDEYHAQLLPDDKLRFVNQLEGRGERLAFVGDGVNDAPALAAATLGIAMGTAGTDVAIETADIALMGDDLSKLALAIRLSRRTRRTVRQNVAFSIGIKGAFLVLAATGWATLWMAVAADMGASLIVVANGLRLLRAPSPSLSPSGYRHSAA